LKASDLLNEMALLDNGWIKIEGPQGVGFLPETAKDEEEWQRECLELHSRLAAEPPLLESTGSPIASATASLQIVRA
jgi:hypothetical protein